jgi:hypothetical protein
MHATDLRLIGRQIATLEEQMLVWVTELEWLNGYRPLPNSVLQPAAAAALTAHVTSEIARASATLARLREARERWLTELGVPTVTVELSSIDDPDPHPGNAA